MTFIIRGISTVMSVSQKSSAILRRVVVCATPGLAPGVTGVAGHPGGATTTRRAAEKPEQQCRRQQAVEGQAQYPGNDAAFGQRHQYSNVQPADHDDIHAGIIVCQDALGGARTAHLLRARCVRWTV